VKADTQTVLAGLQRQLATEKDAHVAQDLRIMINFSNDWLKDVDLWQKYDLPYFNPSQIVFAGIRVLLDDQVPENRRKAALTRLRKYAGVEPGYEPLTTQLETRWKDWTRPGQIGPAKVKVDTDLARSDFFINGI